MRYSALALLCLLFAAPAWAQDKEPEQPAFLKTLAAQGVQIRYLGSEHGLNGWIAVHRGQEQYFYTTADGEAAVSGILLDDKGHNLTLKQVYELRKKNGGDELDIFTEKETPAAAGVSKMSGVDKSFKTPAEQLFIGMENSNWIALGQPGAPVIYTFIDPQCGHCHAFINDLRQKGMFDKGQLQMRIVPVGFKADSRAQAAFLLAVPEPQTRFFKHLDGDETALPVSTDINQQGVERNMAIMQSWKLQATPFTVYKDKQDRVKIIEGRPRNIDALLKDLPAAQPPAAATAATTEN